MADEVLIKVKIDDKGKIHQVFEDGKKASKGLDDVAKSSRTADRNLKGAAQASSNASKNFSKMAQGMGGIVVPAYAAFAAQLFALQAAFGFFKRAGDLQVLQAGQLAYASATGVAMKSLAGDIQAASGAQISFRDASQAAAIGTASGLSADQLTRLGAAAKDVSAVLGRDVTDSFNRLVRGVTKAEPELLDELGIILRLDTAGQNYADSLGKSKDSLNEFERSQAVTNEVLRQAEEKYQAILEATGGGAVNSFNKLGVALDNIVMKIQNFLLPVADAVARVLTDMPLLAGAGFALLASGPLKAVGFDLKEIGSNAKEAAEEARGSYTAMRDQIQAASMDLKDHKKNIQDMSAAMAQSQGAGASKTLQNAAVNPLTPQARANIEKGFKALDLTVEKSTIVQKGMFKGLSVEMVLSYQSALKQMGVAEKGAEANTKVTTMKIRSYWLATTAAVKTAGAAVAGFASKALSAAGWISLIATAGMAAANAFGWTKEMSDSEKFLESYTKKLKELNDEFQHFFAVQEVITRDQNLFTLGSSLGATASMTNQFDPKQEEAFINDVTSALNKQADARAHNQKMREDGTEVTYVNGVYGTITAIDNLVDVNGELTDSEQSAIELFRKQGSTLSMIQEKFGSTLSVTKKYNDLVQNNGSLTNKQTIEYFDLVESLGKTFGNMEKLESATEKSTTAFKASLGAMTPAEALLKDIGTETANLTESQKFLTNEDQEATKKVKDRINELTRLENVIKDLADAENTYAMQQVKGQQNRASIAGNRNKVEAEFLTLSQDVADIEDKITLNAAKQDNFANLKEVLNKTATRSEQQEYDLLVQQAILQKTLLKNAQDKVQRALDLYDINTKLFDLEDQSVEARLKGEQDILNFRKRQADIAQGFLTEDEADVKRKFKRKALERKRSGGPFGYLNEDKAAAEDAYNMEVELSAIRKKAIEAERDMKLEMITLEYDMLEFKMKVTALEMEKLAIELKDKEHFAASTNAETLAKRMRQQITQLGVTEQAAKDLAKRQAAGKISDLGQNLDELIEAKNDLKDINVLTDGIAQSLETNLTSAFQGLIDGTKNFKQAFGQMAVAIIQDITAMLIKMMVMRLLMNSFGGMPIPGQTSAASQSAFMSQNAGPGIKFARDGMKPPIYAGQGYMPKYATGGIARGRDAGYPAVLHGTEAVIPMPHGSIPVEFRGPGGGTQVNNVTVNISTDGTTSTQSTGENNMEQLGSLVASAVQDELINQKRAGGILSPYGSA